MPFKRSSRSGKTVKPFNPKNQPQPHTEVVGLFESKNTTVFDAEIHSHWAASRGDPEGARIPAETGAEVDGEDGSEGGAQGVVEKHGD